MTGPTIGIVGGGQLARMMFQESVALGFDLRFLAATDEDPVVLAGGRHTIGAADDSDALERFASTVDILTFDHEVVDLDALGTIERRGTLVRPGPKTFATVSDKLRMRAAMRAAGLPVPDHREPADGEEAAALVAEEGPHVFKLSHGGYDGRGTHFVDQPSSARDLVDGIVADGGRVLAEPLLELDGELSAVVVRGVDGAMVSYEPVRTVQHDGQCRLVGAPSGLDRSLVDLAREMGRVAAETVGVIGVLAVELFVLDGRLLVNELAARPHNSAHHTLDATVTSQFENHLRAVAGLPLGDPGPTCPTAVTVNVIGRGDHDPRTRLEAALAVDRAAHIHLYGKTPRHDRKLGHVTVCDDAIETARTRAVRVVEALGGQEVPE